jgi:N-acetyl-gamma-glutamylphosphate reductase
MKKKAILAGASGATGSSLLFQLLENKNYSNVLILVRRELRIHHPKLRQLVINFDQISDYSAEIQGDVVFCCLGTNKTQTADPQQYRNVNYQYPLDIAGIAKKTVRRAFT